MTQYKSPTHQFHIPALDGIRGTAIILVLFVHLWVNPLPGTRLGDLLTKATGAMWIGVDLFFVLSGFLITGILYRSVHAKNFFRVFYYRRFLRISPLYYAALIVLMLLTGLLSIHWQGRQFIYLFYLQNTGVFPHFFSTPLSPYISLFHLWSLAVEEQFYLIWPLIVFLVKDARKLLVFTLFMPVLELLLRVYMVLHHSNPFAVYTSVATHSDSLMIGGALSLLLSSTDRIRMFTFRATKILLPFFLLAFLALGFFRGGYSWGAPMIQMTGYTLLGVLFACLVALTLQNELLQSVMSNRILRWFGKYSYGIYFIHPILYSASQQLWMKASGYAVLPTRWMMIASVSSLLVSLALAYASFQFFESRFLRWKDLLQYRFPATAAIEATRPTMKRTVA